VVRPQEGRGRVSCAKAVNQLLSPRDDGDQFFLGGEVMSHADKIGCAWKVDKTFRGEPVKGDG
jgi:hypothetical protein